MPLPRSKSFVDHEKGEIVMLFHSGVDLCVIALGNPGKKYEKTRHNAGFLIVDQMAKELHFDLNKVKFHGIYGTASIDGKKVLFVKPQTFMNLSGDCVCAFARYYKLKPSQIVVISDDVSLDIGKRRVRRKGSAGGHNGLKDIALKIKSEEYPRIKIGVGQKPHPEYDMADWVLSSFTDTQVQTIIDHAPACIGIIKQILKGDFDAAMSEFNK